MTFFDAKINKFGKLSAPNDSAGSYSTNKNAILYIAHEDVSRVISFKGFVDGFKIGLDYGVKIDTEFFKNTGVVKQVTSKFNYSFKLNVPATSVAEAEMNLAKFQELLRYIRNTGGKSSHSKESDAVNSQSFMYVLFANLIQNGLKTDPSVGVQNWYQVRRYGVRCYMTSLGFDPEMEMGVFEKDGKIIPKVYSISFALNIFPDFTPYYKGKVTRGSFRSIEGLDKTGEYKTTDTQNWPFGITMPLSDAHSVNKMGDTGKYASYKGAWIGIANNVGDKFAAFKAFVDKFSFKQENSFSKLENPTDDVTMVLFGGGIKSRKFNVDVNIPSDSLKEARANLAQIQALARFPIKSLASSKNKSKYGLSLTSRDIGVNVYAYFQNLLSKPHSPTVGSLSYNKIKSNGLFCVLSKMDITVDMDAGFFEYASNFIIPKVLKISFEFELNEAALSKLGNTPLSKNKLSYDDDSRWPFGIDYAETIGNEGSSGGDSGGGGNTGNEEGTPPPTLCDEKNKGLSRAKYLKRIYPNYNFGLSLRKNKALPLQKLDGGEASEGDVDGNIQKYIDACK